MKPQFRFRLPLSGRVFGRVRGPVPIAVLAMSLALTVGLIWKSTQAQTDAAKPDKMFRPYALRHTTVEQVHPQLLEFLGRMSPQATIVVDQRNNRLVVEGDPQAHQLAKQLILTLDRAVAQPQSAPKVVTESVAKVAPELALRSYALPDAEKRMAELKQAYASQANVYFAVDARTSQLIVHAPAQTQSEIEKRLGLASVALEGPRRSTVQIRKPHLQKPLHSLEPPRTQETNVEPWPTEGVSESKAEQKSTVATQGAVDSGKGERVDANSGAKWRLRGLDSSTLHSSLEGLIGRPIPVQSVNDGGGVQFQIAIKQRPAVMVAINNAAGEITLTGPPAVVASWKRVIQAIDAPAKQGKASTRLLSLKNAQKQSVTQALVALNQGAAQPGQAPSQGEGKETPPGLQPQGERVQEGGGAGSGGSLSPAEIADALGASGLMGPVQFDIIEGLDVIILRGNQRDVNRVAQLIERIESVAEVTKPAIEVMQLEHIGSEATATLLEQVYTQALTARQGSVSITALGKPNALLLIGRPENVETVKQLVKLLDHPVDSASQFRVFRLKHASAVETQQTIDGFLAESLKQRQQQQNQQQQKRDGLGFRAIVLADARSNSLVVHSSPRDMIEIAALVDRLDVATTEAVNQLKVFKLENSLAEELAPILQEAINSQSSQQGAGQGGQGQAGGQQRNQGGGNAQQRVARSVSLQFLTMDGNGNRRLSSGILSDVRITADPRANAILVTAPNKSMELIGALIQRLDQAPSARSEIKVFTVVNGDAPSLVEMLESLLATQLGGQQGGAGAGAGNESIIIPLRFSVDERTNSIIASGTMKDLAVVDAILRVLDENDVNQRQTRVYRLQNAPADAVATSINEYLRTERDVQQTAPGVLSPFEQIEREVVVVPETVSNTLIVAATQRYYEQIKDLVEQLDERPPMVMVQVLIAEVGLNDTDEFGVELGLQDSLLFDRSVLENIQTLSRTTTTQDPGGVTTTVQEDFVSSADIAPGFNFNNQPLGNSGSDTSLRTAGKTAGQVLSSFAVGRINNELGYGGLVLSAGSESVSVLLRALQESRRLEVLSRPQIMMLNNQEGLVQVGQRVPRISNTQVNDAVQQNDIVLDNVGLILRVVPRISPDGLVVMEIDAEKSDLGPVADGIPISINAAGDAINSPIINTTLMQTTVSANSGQTIVLGGLITKQTADVHRRVPLLADIPLLGNLFRYDMTTQQRTELLIIMTPRVIKDEKDAEMIKQVESARMNWVLSDVISLHGDANLRSRSDEWGDHETSSVYPDMESEEIMPIPQGNAPNEVPNAIPMPGKEGLIQPMAGQAPLQGALNGSPEQAVQQTSHSSKSRFRLPIPKFGFRKKTQEDDKPLAGPEPRGTPGSTPVVPSQAQQSAYQQSLTPLPPVR